MRGRQYLLYELQCITGSRPLEYKLGLNEPITNWNTVTAPKLILRVTVAV
jgi:hypothetical protein